MAILENRSSSLKNAAFLVGAVLVVLTVGSYALGIDHLLDFSRAAMAAVLIIAIVKVWLVTQYFMDIRHSPRWLQIVVNGWTLLTAGVVIGLNVGL
ncbi:cytochrome C oxidase subunit IV family protein [Mycolicibacterium litorale]|uniref:cytochrome C oxidase subunit IV family protein n=1 Tax=Mycolicibacterium litorale TaxID=758802 RepID=UPI003CEDDAC9